jgi:peptide/nickel transport system substrate-binding protein
MKRRSLFAASLSLSLAMMAVGTAHAQPANSKVLRFVPHANLTVLDPIWTTAYVTRNHAYMIYDTLFTEDAKGQIKPQMVESYQVSKDEKTWTFKLRSGLEFHDGKPVTSADVVASLKRWASRDAMGGVLATFITEYQTPDANTFKLVLNQPCGIVLDAFGKASSNVPFIMPARIAATPGTEQIKEHIGSGPFVFKARMSNTNHALRHPVPWPVAAPLILTALNGSLFATLKRSSMHSRLAKLTSLSNLALSRWMP